MSNVHLSIAKTLKFKIKIISIYLYFIYNNLNKTMKYKSTDIPIK